MKTAVEHIFTGTTGSLSGSYDSTKTLLGDLIKQFSGSSASDNYVSPNSPIVFDVINSLSKALV